jgi:hypothetical protein
VNSAFSSSPENKSKTAAGNATGDEKSLHLTHILVVVGFLIGFSMVFGVGLVYTKVIRVRRFKLLDNRGQSCSCSKSLHKLDFSLKYYLDKLDLYTYIHNYYVNNSVLCTVLQNQKRSVLKSFFKVWPP